MFSVSIIAVTMFNVAAVTLGTLAVMLWLRRRGGRWRDFFLGAGIFFLFAMVLEQMLHQLVLRSPAGPTLQGSVWLTGLYGGLAAGVFEEVGRFCAFKLVLRGQRERITALSYGIGHGGGEAFLLLGMTYINNLILMFTLSNGGVLPPALDSAVRGLAAVPVTAYLWALFERIPAVAFHMSASVLVFAAAKQPGKLWLLPAAILLHALLDFTAIVCNAYLPLPVLELLITVFALAVVWLGYRVYNNLQKNQEIS